MDVESHLSNGKLIMLIIMSTLTATPVPDSINISIKINDHLISHSIGQQRRIRLEELSRKTISQQ